MVKGFSVAGKLRAIFSTNRTVLFKLFWGVTQGRMATAKKQNQDASAEENQ